MNASTQKALTDVGELPHVTAKINYGTLVDGVEKYRYDTIDRARTNLVLEGRQMTIHDARSKRDQFSYLTNGFELYDHKSKYAELANTDVASSPVELVSLRDNYQAEMAELVKSITGTPFVFPQPTGFFVRHGSASKIKTAARPATMAHVDFTAETANEMVKIIMKDSGPLPKFRHFAIYQTWRAVSPAPQDSLLCFCDGRFVQSKDCMPVDSILGPEDVPGNVYKMQIGLFNPNHQWFYFSGLTPAEVIMFQGYDTRNPMPILHTSFASPVPNAIPRASIESRLYAFFE